MEIPDNFAT